MKNTKIQFLVGISMMLFALTSSTVAAAGFGTGTTVTNNPPSFTAGPSDGGSSATTPTNVGSNVTFTATATDSNNDQYYLAVCKTDLITPGNDATPTCASSQTWAISAVTNSGSQASVSYTTTSGDAGSNSWYAFVCDKNPSGMCSASSQGSGDSGSPFAVNQHGAFGTVTVTDITDGTIAPGDTLKFKLAQGTIIAGSNINMYICDNATASFDYSTDSCTGGTMICSATNVNPTSADAVCTGGAGLVSVPTAHGDYGFKVYVEDSVSNSAIGNNSQTYTVIDVPPTLVSYTATDTPVIPAGGSDTVDFSASISDANGDGDVSAVEGILFDATPITLSSGTCPGAVTNEQNCYIVPTCTISDVSTAGTGKTATGTDALLTASCQATVWFNANPSDNWEVHVNPTDSIGKETGFIDSNVNLINPELSGIDMVQTSITYGIIELGSASARQITTMKNMGNIAIDVMVSGSDMCIGSYSATCPSSYIPVANQKWYHLDNDFNWSAPAAGPGPYTLVNTASGTGDSTGCLNRDIAVRTAHDSSSTDESIWWRLKIPETQATGSYAGQNVFTSTASSTCTTGQAY